MSTVFRVEKNANYTVMSNIHLKDRSLSLRAKGLLSVILSLPPEWDYTIKGLAHIVADGIDSVRTTVHELEKSGYITRRQTRDELGRMSQNEYHVYEDPKQNPEYSRENTEDNSEKNFMSEKTDNIFLASPSTAGPLKGDPSTAKSSAHTFNKLNKKELNTDGSIHSSSRTARKNDEKDKTERTEGMTDFQHNNSNSFVDNSKREEYLHTIHENIGYDSFPEKEVADELVGIMADVLCSRKATVRVNGEELPTEQVKKRFLELKKAHIEHVLNALESNAGNVRNIRAYLITALYNAPTAVYSAASTHNSATPTAANSNAPAHEKPVYAIEPSFDMEEVFASIKARYKQDPSEDDCPWKGEGVNNWQPKQLPKYVLLE